MPLPRPAAVLAALRDADWLTRERVVGWGWVLLLEEALLLGFLVFWHHGIAAAKPFSIDFLSFYAAGKLALAGTPALAYDQAAHYLAEQAVAGAAAPYQYFFYPPVFLLLCAGLAKLPFLAAYALFETLSFAAFLLVLRSVLAMPGWCWVVPALAFPAVFWNIGLGQNAFLTAALLGGFTVWIDRRPITAGLLLGTLCYKPHFGLLAPVALAASRRWPTFLAASTAVACWSGLSVALFGWGTWHAYFASFAGSGALYTSGRIQFAGMLTPFGASLLLGGSAAQAYALQAASAIAAAGLVALAWTRPASLPLRGATLLTATLLAAPLALLYDQMLLLMAICWLLRAARRDGFLPWEKLTLAACYPLGVVTWPLAAGWHVPLGPVVSLAVLALCLRRLWQGAPVPRPHAALTA